ncbi:MAG: 50S ribosomal protein L13 [Nanoarchaeota archaeon]|nr:50S ribosomal protein L13 [Nanoarchaeota archaeon]
MKIIDGKNAVLGRLASYVAKGALKGEGFVIVNCENVIITGNKQAIKKDYKEKREKVGSGQKGPKVSRLTEQIVKRAIRGMLSNHRKGKGKEAYKRIKCYVGVPKEFESMEKISMEEKNKRKFVRIKEISLK